MHERVRPETLALDALIQETISRAEVSTQAEPADTLLFLGNQHQAFPTAVIKDPVLAPVDKLVWMVIMLEVRETGDSTAFPGYAGIAEMANIASRSTIARAIAILRATRWLTLCGRIREASGRFRGNVYALHDEPLPLADAIHLDSDYMVFLKQAVSHGHARVRAVAQGVLCSLDEDIRAGRPVCAREHPIERRLEATVEIEKGGPRRFFAFTHQVIRQLRQHGQPIVDGETSPVLHDQKSNMDKQHRVRKSTHQKSNPVSRDYPHQSTSSSGKLSKFDLGGEEDKPLIYPKRLGDNQRDITNRYLRPLAPEQRQQLLDELEGRFQAEQKGMKPVYDEISFLVRLCKLAMAGEFQPNLGIKVAESRRARDAIHQRRSKQGTQQAPKETEAQRQQRLAVAQDRIMAMRKVLGSPQSSKSDKVVEGP
ncbi:MAG: STY4528 family pathogenicity island replication protein [Candidatus Thiodiazotropha sp. (ex. Lucinoma kazani)]